MCSAQSKNMLVMNILDVLKIFTDENHRLNQKDIVEKLESYCKMTVDRKAVKRNLMNRCRIFVIFRSPRSPVFTIPRHTIQASSDLYG